MSNGFDLSGSRFANPFRGEANSPTVDELGGARCKNSVRTVTAGGDVAQRLQHPSFEVFERVYRKLPPSGILTASPDRPSTFEIGAFQVENQKTLAITTYEFLPFVQGGIGGAQPLSDGAESTSIGFDINVSNTLNVDSAYQLVPTPTQAAQQAAWGDAQFEPVITNQVDLQSPAAVAQAFGPTGPLIPSSGPVFNPTDQTRANSFVKSAPRGSATLPQQRARMGSTEQPFTIYVPSTSAVQLRAIVYNPVTVPIAFFQARISGFMLDANVAAAVLEGLKPCS